MSKSLKVRTRCNAFDSKFLRSKFIKSIYLSMWSDDVLGKLVDKLIREHKADLYTKFRQLFKANYHIIKTYKHRYKIPTSVFTDL